MTLKLKFLLTSLALVFLAFAACSKQEPAAAAPATAGPRTVALTAGDNMKYNLTEIDATAGEQLHVTLANVGSLPKEAMGHDWVLLNAGSDAEAYDRAAIAAKDTGYQPPALASEVLAAIPLLGPHQTGEVTFKAPLQPGQYPFLCTFPAHYQAGMHGVLVVK
ncbi:MAG TPA: plastocyanin/azurin family copper-binding protein [Opitutaceae bacterium]|nr:plastocyanin/azurin family copper-binding protein [Opitutaceae bacterium]